MDPRLDEVLRLISPAGAVALRELMMLHVQAARSPGYHPSTPEFTKELGLLMGRVPDADVGILVLRLDPVGFGGVRPFFEAEGARRSGRINAWLFRGVLPDHTPDILTITIVREPAPAVAEPLVSEIKP